MYISLTVSASIKIEDTKHESYFYMTTLKLSFISARSCNFFSFAIIITVIMFFLVVRFILRDPFSM